jgi:hypothetical protein
MARLSDIARKVRTFVIGGARPTLARAESTYRPAVVKGSEHEHAGAP